MIIEEEINEVEPTEVIDYEKEQKELEAYLKKVKETYEPNRLVTFYLDERRKAKGKLKVDKRVIYELQDYFSVWELKKLTPAEVEEARRNPINKGRSEQELKSDLRETLIPRLLLIDITGSIPYLRRQGEKRVINGITGW